MRSIILLCLIFFFTLTGCAPADNYEPMVGVAVSTQEGAEPVICTAWPAGLSFDIFPLEKRTLQIQADGLQPDDQPVLQIKAMGDEGDDLIELQPSLTAAGSFQEIVTLPAYDYMRWSIRLLHPDGAACQFIIFGGDEWLEMGVEKPAAGDDEAYLQDVEMMATDLGIPVEEALRRQEYEGAITELQARLRANEADSFAGLWIEHEPKYRVVAAFTGDAQELLAQYVDSDHPLADVVEARSATYTYEQLMADQQAAGRLLEQIGFSAASGINVQENQVEIFVTDRAAFEAALAASGAELPPSVAVTTAYEPLGEIPPFAVTPVPEVFMAQLKQRDVAFMEALLSGKLVIDKGCLRVQNDNESYLVIWQADYFLTDNDGVLEILDETGTAVAEVGEMVYMGGREQAGVRDAELRQPVPEICGGPYWRMGQFLPEEYLPDAGG